MGQKTKSLIKQYLELMNQHGTKFDKTNKSVLLTHCDVDDKPKDTDTDDLLTQVAKLNLLWKGSTTNTERELVLTKYHLYHSIEVDIQKNIELDLITTCMKEGWKKRQTDKFPWILKYVDLIQKDAQKKVMELIAK